MELKQLHSIYFIGIGGIGMSALARYFSAQGCRVAGYDRTETELTRNLVAEGMELHYTDMPELLSDSIDLVVYTPAVPSKLGELVRARALGIPMMKRAELLGLISRHHRTIAVAGTHGKTSTSSLTAHLLRSAGVDCTAFLGGIALNQSTNYLSGSSEWLVVEADEYDRSFLHLQPELAVILSADADHLDVYGDAASMQREGFEAFAKCLKPGGTLLLNAAIEPRFAHLGFFSTYGLDSGNYRAEQIRVENGRFVFDYRSPKSHWKNLTIEVPGRHNVENAVAALALAEQLDLEELPLRSALANYRGVKRRFERVFENEDLVFIDDYAHHPVELRAAINAARELFPGRWLTGMFQPHLFSRTRDFLDGFAEALDGLDEVWLLDIYPAREEPIPGVSSAVILKRMKNPNARLIDKADILASLQNLKPGVLLSLGAGDIDAQVAPVKQHLEQSFKSNAL